MLPPGPETASNQRGGIFHPARDVDSRAPPNDPPDRRLAGGGIKKIIKTGPKLLCFLSFFPSLLLKIVDEGPGINLCSPASKPAHLVCVCTWSVADEAAGPSESISIRR